MNRLNSSQRGLSGYQYSSQVSSDMQTIQPMRNIPSYSSVLVNSLGNGLSLSGSGLCGSGRKKRCNEYCKCQQCGQGIMDSIKNAYSKGKAIVEKAKSLGSKAKDIYTSDLSTTIQNMLPSTDETARNSYPGEMHAILKLKNGMGKANYMGPGTNIVQRIRQNDPPRTISDKVAQAHDIRYSLGSSQQDVQNADLKMINKLQSVLKNREDNDFNVNMGLRPIQAKYNAEKLGLVPSGKIASFGDVTDPADRALLQQKLTELEQEGFGMLPGEMLKNKLLKTYKTVSGNETLRNMADMLIKHALPVIVKKMGGSGLKLAGQGKKLSQSLYMAMLKKQDNGASRNLDEVLGTDGNMRGNGIMDTLKKIKPYAIEAGKYLLPIVMKHAEKKIKEKMEGSGKKKKLKKVLNDNISNAMVHYIRNDKNVKKMYGNGFWQDFGDGFVKGFTNTLKFALPMVKGLL